MDGREGRWIHFQLDSSSRHEAGYTVYKILAFRQVPVPLRTGDPSAVETVQQLLLWPRYSHILGLHRDVRRALASSNDAATQKIASALPELKKPSTFGRFSQGEIWKREQSVQDFFDFLASLSVNEVTCMLDMFFADGQLVSVPSDRGIAVSPSVDSQLHVSVFDDEATVAQLHKSPSNDSLSGVWLSPASLEDGLSNRYGTHHCNTPVHAPT